MTEYIISTFGELVNIPGPSGYTKASAQWVMQKLTDLGFCPVMTEKGGVFCDLGGDGEPLLMSAHLDTLGAMVAGINANGSLKLSNIGGLQPHNTEAENCWVFTRGGKTYTGTIQLHNPSTHVNFDYQTKPRVWDNMELILDERTSNKEETLALGIRVGDIVAADPRFVYTESGFVKSRFLDDKLSVAILLGLAKDIAENKLKPNRKLYFYATVFEETGHGCAHVPQAPVEILCVDMGCVGDGLNCTEYQTSICVKDSRGPSNYDMVSALIDLAEANHIDYALDVYPKYGSDADAALAAGYDARHVVVGSGVFASHGYERTHRDGIENTYRLVKAYALR